MRTPGRPQTHRVSLAFVAQCWLEALVVSLFVVMFVVQPFRVPSASMLPTMRVGDAGLIDRQAFAGTEPKDTGWAGWFHGLMPRTTVRRGDLVVFLYPADPSRTLVKRVVALPGERVRLRRGRVLIDGQSLAEPYAQYTASVPNDFRDQFPSVRRVDPDVDPAWWVRMRAAIRNGEMTVPADSYFVLGDNRNDSQDSRYWGFVRRGALLGRPLLVYASAGGRRWPRVLH